MSSKTVLRAAVVDDSPQIIENEFVASYVPAPPSLLLDDDLVEALQFEHPDAEPDEIQDALQEVMDQLRDGPTAEFQFGDEEPPAASEGDFDFDLEADVAESLTLEPETPAMDFEATLEPEPKLAPEPQGPSSSDVLEQARSEAQRILAEADDRAAEIQKAAYDKGYAEGFDAGKSDGEAKGVGMVRQAVAIVDQATELHDSMLREAEGEMVALCLEVARKVIHTEAQTNAEVVKAVVDDAVKRINGSPRVIVKVHPDQLEDVKSHWETAFGPDYREKEWVIEGDVNVDLGGCVLDTRYGSIDARIGTQFSQVQKTFELLLGSE